MPKSIGEKADRERLEVFKAAGYNISEAARLVGITRGSFQRSVRKWLRKGWISEDDLGRRNSSNVQEYARAKGIKVQAFERKKAKGDWRKPSLVKLPCEPFRLKLFGDPHLDDDGADFQLFEDHFLDMQPGVYGVCVGDWFNNWVRVLSTLYADNATRPADAWILLESLMERRGEFLLAACSGNHDDWSHGPTDPVADLMRRYGVRYREGAIRLALGFEDLGRTITVAIRHKWQGRSIYSPGHGLKRAAMWGWRDNIMVGGHTHVDDFRLHVNPEDQFKTHAFQISSLKAFDQYADTHGFMGHRISPVVDLVIDPRRADDDIELVKPFWDSRAAAAYLRAIRDAN